jgi:hypothetical protein
MCRQNTPGGHKENIEMWKLTLANHGSLNFLVMPREFRRAFPAGAFYLPGSNLWQL